MTDLAGLPDGVDAEQEDQPDADGDGEQQNVAGSQVHGRAVPTSGAPDPHEIAERFLRGRGVEVDELSALARAFLARDALLADAKEALAHIDAVAEMEPKATAWKARRKISSGDLLARFDALVTEEKWTQAELDEAKETARRRHKQFGWDTSGAAPPEATND